MLAPRDVIVRELRPADEAPAIELLADAFLDFPAMHLLVGDDSGSRDRLKRVFAMEFEPASHLSALVAELDSRIVGALTWVDSPGCSDFSANRMVRFVRIAGPRIFRTLRAFGRIERAHLRTPHRHLPTIGVAPELQSAGIGHRLLEVFDAGCDRVGRPGYLETVRWADPAMPSLERFYERQGYTVATVIPMTAEWSVLTMFRPPAPASG